MTTIRTTPLRKRMREELRLAGIIARTQEACLRGVGLFAAHFALPPDQLTEAQLRDYFLQLRNEKQFAPASLRIAFYGIRFFLRTTVARYWPTLATCAP